MEDVETKSTMFRRASVQDRPFERLSDSSNTPHEETPRVSSWTPPTAAQAKQYLDDCSTLDKTYAHGLDSFFNRMRCKTNLPFADDIREPTMEQRLECRNALDSANCARANEEWEEAEYWLREALAADPQNEEATLAFLEVRLRERLQLNWATPDLEKHGRSDDAPASGHHASDIDCVLALYLREKRICHYNEDARLYAQYSLVERALRRSFPVMLTLIVEVLVATVITEGGDSLADYIGRHLFTLAVGVGTVISAVSGNVGLQSSSLTVRGIALGTVNKTNVGKTILSEVAVSAMIMVWCGMTCMIAVSLLSSSWQFGAALTVAMCLAMVVAGFSGTVAPIVFSFCGDPALLAGPMETAVQDIVGATALYALALVILKMLGFEPPDSAGETDDV